MLMSLRAATASTNPRHAINPGRKVAGRENQRLLLLLPVSITLQEIMTSRRQYEIAMIGSRGAQASWGAFLMTAFATTGAQAARSAPHETVGATMITETAAHTFHRYTEHASLITGIAHQSAWIVPLVGGLSMRTPETEHRSVVIDHHLNVLVRLIAMKPARRALTAMNRARRAGPLSLRATTT
jgi:hypothetical protein